MQTEGQADMTKLIAAFRNFAKEPKDLTSELFKYDKNELLYPTHTHIYTYTQTHTYIYIYIYIYTHTHTHTHTHTNSRVWGVAIHQGPVLRPSCVP
jgi:hypothetical protein